jgi:hypothetical protein
MIGETLSKDKVVGIALVSKLIQKDVKLVNKGALKIYKPYFEANVENVNESSLGNPFCRNYNTIILIKF